MPHISLRRLHYFVALADALHFGRAAEALDVSQPALSGEIKKLEQELGVVLLTRRPRPALTREGKVLVHRARTLLASADRFEAEARQLAQGVRGSVTIGCVPTFFLRALLEAVAEVEDTWPGIAIHLVELNTSAQLALLDDGAIDIACCHSAGQSPDLHRVRIADEQFRLVAPPGSDVRTLEDARDLPFITVRRDVSPDFWEKAVTVCSAAGFEPQVRYESMTWAAVVTLVRSGRGFSLLPAIIADNNTDIVVPSPLPADARAQSWIVMREKDTATAVGQVFELLQEAFGHI